MRLYCQWLVVGALMLSIGLHWVAMQSVAWVGMIITYSQEAGVSVAIEKTFDGRHACKMCQRVAEGMKDGTQKAPNDDAKKKLDLMATSWTDFVFQQPSRTVPDCQEVFTEDPVQEPPLPPPRGLA